LNQPYVSSPWMYTGSDAVSNIPNPEVVDWVLVEIRDAATAAQAIGSAKVGRQVAWLLSDGSIAGLNGTSNLQFNHSLIHQLFVVIWHRNHLAILSANPLVKSAGIYHYDFSINSSQIFGGSSGAKEIIPGVWGMISGDGNADGFVDIIDRNSVWSLQAGNSGYLPGDFNMNGNAKNQDKNDKWRINLNRSSQVPQ